MKLSYLSACVYENNKLQQYMMSGWWKNKEVAIRVANDNALTVDGLEFIEEAVTAMKYVSVCICIAGQISELIILPCRKFEHPNLLKLYGLCTRQGALFVVTELLQQQGIKLCTQMSLYIMSVCVSVYLSIDD